jgi:tetratricopeptide (TPR) repeat protein
MVRRKFKLILPLLLALACLVSVLLSSSASAADEKAKEMFNKGVTSEKEGKVDDAILAYKGAITADPGFVDAYLNLGAIYFQKNQFDDAAKLFQTASEKDPKSVDAFANLARVEMKAKRYVEAETAFKAAIALNDKDASLHKELGRVYFEKGNFSEAVAELDKCNQLGSGDTATYYMIGKCYEKDGKKAEAIEALKKSNSLKENYRANFALGSIYLDQQNYLEAAKMFKAALKADPKGYFAAYNYASAMESANQDAIDQNITNWQEFIRIAKNNPKAKDRVAEAQDHVKQLQQSKSAKASGN